MGPVSADTEGIELVCAAFQGEAEQIVLHIDVGVAVASVEPGIVAAAILVLVAVEIEAHLHAAEAIVKAWTADIDAWTVAVPPMAERAGPGAVGRAIIGAIAAGAQALRIAAHALMQSLDGVEAIEHRSRRCSRIE